MILCILCVSISHLALPPSLPRGQSEITLLVFPTKLELPDLGRALTVSRAWSAIRIVKPFGAVVARSSSHPLLPICSIANFPLLRHLGALHLGERGSMSGSRRYDHPSGIYSVFTWMLGVAELNRLLRARTLARHRRSALMRPLEAY